MKEVSQWKRFVWFELPDDAKRAVDESKEKGIWFDSKWLNVSFFEPRSEREQQKSSTKSALNPDIEAFLWTSSNLLKVEWWEWTRWTLHLQFHLKQSDLQEQTTSTKSGSKTRPADAYKHVCPETRTSTRNARIPNKPWIFTRNDGSRNADDVSARLQPNEDGSHAWNGRNDGCSNEDSNASNKRCFWRICVLTTVQRTDQQSWVRQFWRWRQEEQDRRPHLPICWEDRWTWKCSKNHWNDHWPRNGRPRVFNEFSDAAQREDQRGYWVASRRTSRRLVY